TTPTAQFAHYANGGCTALSGTHDLEDTTSDEWLTPTKTCPAGVNVTPPGQLQSTINQAGTTVVCLQDNATYLPTSAITLNSHATELVGDPLQRPIIDASNVNTVPTDAIQ